MQVAKDAKGKEDGRVQRTQRALRHAEKNNSDRIIIGTVTDIQPFYDHTIVTISVDEWLMNPLSTETITVRTKIGTNVVTEDEPTFALNETIILMLEDVNISDDRFGVVFKNPGNTRYLTGMLCCKNWLQESKHKMRAIPETK